MTIIGNAILTIINNRLLSHSRYHAFVNKFFDPNSVWFEVAACTVAISAMIFLLKITGVLDYIVGGIFK